MCDDINKNSNNSQDNRSVTRDALGLSAIVLTSVFSGFLLGLLFAPRSGYKTRKIIEENVKDVADRGKFTLAKARVICENLLDKSKNIVDRVSTIIKGAGETGEP
ncbi:MAG: YtxH domain-containing protein [Candidatus Humimicrobiaceae bacterium]|jgi:gas vesicle protein|nr:YtxH domain-containing protein [Actinomycetota bacterium]MDD5601040.1 YtxH domain-containing protein [Actinomycetota bacterium]MDY0027756.1 YtxH domain-containing protein [Candidatus Humimicrobiaceae bacterium]